MIHRKKVCLYKILYDEKMQLFNETGIQEHRNFTRLNGNENFTEKIIQIEWDKRYCKGKFNFIFRNMYIKM